MRTMVAGFLFLLLAACALAQQKAQPLNVKLGLWETTSTTKTTGQPPISPEMLSRLTPEQRAQIEARMKMQFSGQPHTTTRKSCLTKEKLDKAMAFGDEEKNCHRTLLTSTSSKIAMKVECAQEGMKGGGTMQFEALNPETVKGSGHMSGGDGTHTMNFEMTYSAKWLGPACGKVD